MLTGQLVDVDHVLDVVVVIVVGENTRESLKL
jgi:hypothetical protein